jgi:hypothetical protein
MLNSTRALNTGCGLMLAPEAGHLGSGESCAWASRSRRRIRIPNDDQR